MFYCCTHTYTIKPYGKATIKTEANGWFKVLIQSLNKQTKACLKLSNKSSNHAKQRNFF